MKLVPDASAAPDIDTLVVAMRPRLHRYCARMVGSVIDGEDVLQDALIKAVESFASAGPNSTFSMAAFTGALSPSDILPALSFMSFSICQTV